MGQFQLRVSIRDEQQSSEKIAELQANGSFDIGRQATSEDTV
jgi:hypothetical protein